MEENWDYLLVLDACRHDYFKRLHKSYLTSGKLYKAFSPASSTPNWCKKVFRDYYEDTVYVSANPFVNSSVEVRGVEGYKHFYKVIDVWDKGWKEDKGTVPPENVNRAVLAARDEYPDKRIVAHYMQPHAPYLTLELQGSSGKINQVTNKKSSGLFSKMREHVNEIFLRIFSHKPIWKLREKLNQPPANPVDATLREVGEKGLRKAYEENLKIALEKITCLSKELSGKIVITADHGELLGEEGLYEHPGWKVHPILREVPWFVFHRNGKSF